MRNKRLNHLDGNLLIAASDLFRAAVAVDKAYSTGTPADMRNAITKVREAIIKARGAYNESRSGDDV
jgi:hypothetical protein